MLGLQGIVVRYTAAMPITVDTLGEIKEEQTENSCLFSLNVLLSSSLYMLIQLFSSISVNSGF